MEMVKIAILPLLEYNERMKVWIKYLIGIGLGLASYFILPMNNANVSAVVAYLSELFVHMIRYIVVPLLFFTGAVSVNKLRSSKLILKATLWTFAIIIISSLILTLIGLASILIVRLPRLPITVDSSDAVFSLQIPELIRSILPLSAFETLSEGNFLLVSFVFAFLIGWVMSGDQTAMKSAFNLFDSLSKLFYGIATFFTEIFSVGMIAVVCNWTVTYRTVIATGIFNNILIMFAIDFVIVAGIIYPALLYWVCHDTHPYRVLYASITSLLSAFFSGDTNMVLPLNIRHGKESLGIRRRTSGFSFPIFSIFARGGSALVVTVSFIVIWRSYSSLAISLNDVIWISLSACGLSFALCGLPSGSAFVLLAILCTKYSKGLDTSYLLLQPVAPIICSFAALFDALTAMFGTYIVAVKTKTIEHHAVSHYI